MAQKFIHLAAGLISAVVMLPAYADTAADAAQGKKLHDAKCTGCHAQMRGGDGSSMYTREDRKVHSLAALAGQVEGCNHQIQSGFSPEEIKLVIRYLNQTFYKF